MNENKIIEVGENGSTIDISLDNEINDSEYWKNYGNKHFIQHNYLEAIECYNKAILLNSNNSIYYANRSACYFGLKDYDNSIIDAYQSIELDSNYIKGYYRLINALFYKKDYELAYNYIQKVDKISGGNNNKEILKIKKDIEKILANNNNNKQKKTLSFNKLYDDKPNISNNNEENNSKRAYEKIKQLISKNEILLDGLFNKLLDKNLFQQIIFPGLTEQVKHLAPKSFEELLNNPIYSNELEKNIPIIIEKAQKVLDGAKKRGASIGEYMDEETERYLWPQIIQEAFSRELVSIVSKIHSKLHSTMANDLSQIAIYNENQTNLNILNNNNINDLISTSVGYVTIDNFLGEEWCEIILEDIQQFQLQNNLNEIPQINKRDHLNSIGKIAWIEKDLIKDTYAALYELIDKLHLLPFELNLKANLQLCRPFSGSTLLTLLTKDCAQPMRLDSHINETTLTGYRITCIYFINNSSSKLSGALRLQQQNEMIDIPVKSDRLVLFRSNHISNERLIVEQDENLYSITFWIHGPPIGNDVD